MTIALAVALSTAVASPSAEGSTLARRLGHAPEAEMRKIGPGVTAMVMHIGLADAELSAATADRPTWGAEWRQRDFDFFTGERFRGLVKELGLTLVTWRQIGALGARSASTR